MGVEWIKSKEKQWYFNFVKRGGRENKNPRRRKTATAELRRQKFNLFPLSLSEIQSEEEPKMERIHVTVRARPLSPADAKTSPWKISGNSIFIPNYPNKFEFGMFLLISLLCSSVFLPNFAFLAVFLTSFPSNFAFFLACRPSFRWRL